MLHALADHLSAHWRYLRAGVVKVGHCPAVFDEQLLDEQPIGSEPPQQRGADLAGLARDYPAVR